MSLKNKKRCMEYLLIALAGILTYFIVSIIVSYQ